MGDFNVLLHRYIRVYDFQKWPKSKKINTVILLIIKVLATCPEKPKNTMVLPNVNILN